MRFPGPPEKWNDWLALVLVLGLPMIWMFGHLDATVLGATISGWMLVIQFYFRKSPPEVNTTSTITSTTTPPAE